MKRLAWLLLCLLGASAGDALAQGRSVSYSTWIVSGNMVTLRFLLPVSEAQRLVGAGVPVLTMGKLGDYLLAHQSVQSAGGECPAIDQGFDLGKVNPLAVEPDLYGFEIFYRCADPRRVVLGNRALFAEAPDHISFARIQSSGVSVEHLFTAARQSLALPDDGAVAPTAFGVYVRLGLMHILTSADRWIFLLGALLLVRRRLDAAYLLIAVAVGYLLSLLVTSADLVSPRMPRIDAFLGLLVALLGATLVQIELRGRAGWLARWPTALLLLVLAVALLRAPSAVYALLGGAALSAGFLACARWFGEEQIFWAALIGLFTFLDGFALPALLAPAQLPHRTQMRMLIGFDLGAILIAVLLICVPAGAWLSARARTVAAPRAWLKDLCAACLCGLGTFWLISRLGP